MKGIFEQTSHNDTFLVNWEIYDMWFRIFRLQSEPVNQLKVLVEDSNTGALSFHYIVIFAIFCEDYLLYCTLAVQIVYLCYSILTRDLRIGWWYNFVLLISSILVFWLLHHSDVFDYVLCEFRPLQVTISVDIDGLKKFDQVGDKEKFGELVVGHIEFFYQVDKCR